jgi:hypothetical protein
MSPLVSILIGLVAWALLACVCGMVVGRIIEVMHGDEELRDSWRRLPV